MSADDNEFDIERARRGKFDSPLVERHRPRNPNWLAIIIGFSSIVFQIGTFLWYGGRLSQRVDNLEAVQVEARQRDAAIYEDNGKQNVTLGIIGQQYGEINRRLDGIERKLDHR